MKTYFEVLTYVQPQPNQRMNPSLWHVYKKYYQ